MTVSISLDISDLDVLHDIVLDALHKEMDVLELMELFEELPDTIKGLAVQWGLSDTVVGDDIYKWLQKNKTI